MATEVQGGAVFRPRRAAEYMGIGESTFWALRKSDPNFQKVPRDVSAPVASGTMDMVVKSFEEAARCSIARIAQDFRQPARA